MQSYSRWAVLVFSLCVFSLPLLFQNCSKVSFTPQSSFLEPGGGNSATGNVCPEENPAFTAGDAVLNGPAGGYTEDPQTFTVSIRNSCYQVADIIWNAGDGSGSEQSSPINSYSHTYNNPGHYVVTVFLVDALNRVTQLETVVDIVDKCPASSPCQLNENQYSLQGPGIAFVGDSVAFSMIPRDPAPAIVKKWDFGDSQTIATSSALSLHTYGAPGQYVVSTTIETETGVTRILKHNILILPAGGSVGPDLCLASVVTVTGPTRLAVKQNGHYSFYLKDCETSYLIRWYIDGVEVEANGKNLVKSWNQSGLYHVEARAFVSLSDTVPIYVASAETWVTDTIPTEVVEPEPEKLTCGNLTEGQRVTLGDDLTSERVTCGNRGYKTQYHRQSRTYECRAGNLSLVDQTGTFVSETSCQNQSCDAPGGLMGPGDSRTFFSTGLPTGACSTVSQVRICNGDSGTLSGNVQYSTVSCRAGCGTFGIDGSQKEIVGSQTIKEAKVCSFGETGIFNIFEQKIQQKCNDGTVVNVSTSKGNLLTAGVCPSYTWVQKSWSACSANCGGSQTAQYACEVNGSAVPAGQENRCGAKPTKTQVCDGAPNVTEVTTAFEYANATTTCPANKIGSVIRERQVTTTKSCVNHAMTPKVVNGAWVENTYCRELVPYRCSQDTLSPSQAYGRLRWMEKCSAQVPMIKEFFERTAGAEFAPQNVLASTKKDLGNGQISFGRMTYATFLKADGTAWSAPAPGSTDYTVYKASAQLNLTAYSCTIPVGVYIASVCTSSCATPSQRVLTDIQMNQYESFISALTQKTQTLTTLTEESATGKMSYQKTRVQSFVTELVDGKHEILLFKMASGGKVELTPNHPILTDEGTMKLAGDWKVGDRMIRISGTVDPVVSIEKFTHTGKVYNVFMANDKPMTNVIVTEGYLNGSAFFQNQGIDLLNRQILRTRFTNGVK